MDILRIARKWTQLGISVIPIMYRDKRPNGHLLGGGWEEYKTRLPEDTELLKWFSGNLHNIGLIVGWKNLVVIDFDDLPTYSKWLLWTSRKGGITEYAANHTYQVETARGIHLYIYTPHQEQNRKLPGIDIKARGGYVLIPPSIHPSGKQYRAINPNAPIIMVEALSDIIPPDLLTEDTEYLPLVGVSTQFVAAPAAVDPWQSALNVPDPSRELVTQVREKHSILSLLPGSQPSSSGKRWYLTSCPFHDDKNPSFWIDTQRGICGCYGGCTPKPLDVINLYARLRGITNREAIFYLSRL